MPISWQPAIYEHKAALIGKSPSEVSRSAEDLALACRREVELYKTTVVTVGIDVYNVELEALGAPLCETQGDQCPDLKKHMANLEQLPEILPMCEIPGDGRFQLMLNAAKILKAQVDPSIRINIPVSGPMTMASKWVGMEDLIVDMYSDGEDSTRLLDHFEKLALVWTSCILDHGFDAMVFDSMAAPPMMSPELYREHIFPRHTRLFDLMQKRGQKVRELVIGGDTTSIAFDEAQTGANIILCDYASNAKDFAKAMPAGYKGQVRRNINPTLLLKGLDSKCLESFKEDLALFENVIAGTGILSYHFSPSCLINFMQRLEQN